MQKQYYFISGLPRSGSTLLSAILNQNADIKSEISGPLARFSRAIIEQSSDQGGYRFQCPAEKRKLLIQNLFETYYSDSNATYNFNCNRGWSLMLPLLKDLFPYTKVILCVRDLPWVLDSFETLIRKNPYSATTMFSPDENINVYTRANTLMRSDRPVGFAFEGVKHAITSLERNMLYILEYDQLAKNPEKTMREIHHFLNIPYYQYDFNNVESTHDEFDSDVNLKGLHTTRKEVKFIERQSIIPPDLWEQYKHYSIWRR